MKFLPRLLAVALLTHSASAAEPVRPVGQGIDLPADPKLKLISGAEHVRWSRRLKIDRADSGGIQAAVFSGRSYYLAGKKWNKESNQERLWIWRVNLAGKRVWEKEFDAQNAYGVVELLPGTRESPDNETEAGVRVVYSSALSTQTRIAHVSANGDIESTELFPWPDQTAGVFQLEDGDLLLFGATMQDINKPDKGWVARTNARGDVRWKHTFAPDVLFAGGQGHPGAQQSEAQQLTPAKGLHQYAAFDRGVELADHSVVLVGQFGRYSKFGVGDSRLWLLRADSDGKKVAEAFVDDAYSGLPLRQPVVASATKLAIRHWKLRNNDDRGKAPEHHTVWPWLSRFDHKLQLVSDGDMQTRMAPSAVTIGGWQPGMFPMHGGNTLLIRWSDSDGLERQKVEVGSHGFITPLMTLMGDDGVLSVNNVRHASVTSSRQEVLLLLLKPTDE